MKNHKQLLMDFYLNLLMQPKSIRRKLISVETAVKIALAGELGCSAELVQNIFERMASEDR